MKKTADVREVKYTWKLFLLSFAFLIGMSPLFLFYFYRNYQRNAIRQDQAFTTGSITRFEYHSRNGRHWYETFATYQAGSVAFTCTGKAVAALTLEQRRSLLGVRLPVIYEKVNPSNGELLSSERQFDRFNLSFPDSLTWAKSYFLE